jgi:hypothetical protein
MAMVATVVSAFSRDGPPGKTPVMTHRALSVAAKHAATTALVVALALPTVEPAWSATYSNEEVMSAITKLDQKVEGEVAIVKTMIENVNSKIDVKFDSIKNDYVYAPFITAVVGIEVSRSVSRESSKNGDQTIAKAKKSKPTRVFSKACNKQFHCST